MELYAEKLGLRVKKKRIAHCRNVMLTAQELAEKFGADVEKAKIAGLMHDYARDVPEDELFRLAGRFSLTLHRVERKLPVLLHGPVGAELLKTELDVNDEEVLEAVTYHTTAAPNMSLLAKIIYLADIIEPSRGFRGVEKIRELVEKGDLSNAFFKALDFSIMYCIQKQSLIHPITIEARNSLLESSE